MLTTFVVDTHHDILNPNDGATSLREAVVAANLSSGADEIRFASSLNGKTIFLSGSPLSIDDLLTIRGPGADRLAISGDDASNVISVLSGGIATIEGLTIRDGAEGAIRNAGALSVSNTLITNNQGYYGGGIYNTGALQLIDSQVSGNTAHWGGGIYTSGPMTLRNSNVIQNIAFHLDPINIALAGGIFVSEGMATIVDSTISYNSVTIGRGNGIVVNEGSSLIMENSTLNGNRPIDFGSGGRDGALYIAGTASVDDSTISGNAMGIYVASRGQLTGRSLTVTDNSLGMWNDHGSVSLYNTIVAGNRDSDFGSDSYSAPVNGAYNLIGAKGGAGGFVDGVDGNLVGVDTLLGPLQNNLGPTATHALLPGSLAIDRGDQEWTDSTDQRGRARPQGLAVDIGAFELKQPVHLIVTTTDAQDSITIDHTQGVTAVTQNGNTSRFADAELLSVTIDARDGNDSIHLNSTPMIPMYVYAGAGDDTLRIGDGDVISGVLGAVVVYGGAGQNQMTIDDGASQAGIIRSFDPPVWTFVEHTYTLTSDSFRKTDSIAGHSPQIRFDAIGQLTLEASGTTGIEFFDEPATTVNVLGIANNTALEINGNGGDDRFVIGPGLLLNRSSSSGAVFITGGDGDDELAVSDRPRESSPYELRDYRLGVDSNDHNIGHIQKFEETAPKIFIESEVVSFRDIESATLDADDRDSTIHVDATVAATRYTLRGNDGKDEFLIAAEGLSSNVSIHGGAPATVPGDALMITGFADATAVYSPHVTESHAGTIDLGSYQVDFDGLEPVALEKFESVTMVTPRSYDNIQVLPQANDWTEIAGFSGGFNGSRFVNLPFETLSFRDVRHVTLDTASQDISSFQFPRGADGIVYGPFPNDIVTILSGYTCRTQRR